MNIANLDVPEILRVGLSGLCFLLAVLAFTIIRAEQKRPEIPRKGIERMIYIFMAVNLISSVLCFFRTGVGESEPPPVGDYVVEYTSYTVDLSQWKVGGTAPVVVTRTDRIRKNTTANKNFTIPFSTTGTDITCEPLSFTTKPHFVKKNDPLAAGIHYDYVLPVGHQPNGYTETITSMFVFPNGFKNPDNEWWAASVPYFARAIVANFIFPEAKPCKSMEASTISGNTAPVPISDNVPSRFEGGRKAQWLGLNQEAKSRIDFNWQW